MSLKLERNRIIASDDPWPITLNDGDVETIISIMSMKLREQMKGIIMFKNDVLHLEYVLYGPTANPSHGQVILRRDLKD